MTPAELRAPSIASLHALLKPLGYRKAGVLFSRRSADVVHLIELQSSRTNLSDDARFTINAGVFAPSVVYEDIRDRTKPSIAAAHWRERIGFLSPAQRDAWWTISNAQEAEEAAREISGQVATYALPALAALPDLESLIRLWHSGKSPGVPPKLRDDFLLRLGLGPPPSAA